jgi:hypothetical protein
MVLFGGSGTNSTPDDLKDVWALQWSTTVGVRSPGLSPPAGFLRPPSPNPFTGTTAIHYSIARAGWVQVNVYDPAGRLVRRLVERQGRAGPGTAVWDGTNEAGSRQAAGVYLVRVAGPGIDETRKIVLMH